MSLTLTLMSEIKKWLHSLSSTTYLLLVNVVQKNKIVSHLRCFREKLANIRQLVQRSVDGPQIGSAAR